MNKEEILSKLTAMEKRSYESQKYYDEMERLEQQVCNMILPEILNNKGWYDEIINKLNMHNFQDERIENEVKPRFIEVASKMADEIRKKKSGNRGERNVTNFLKEARTYFEDACLMNNVSLKVDDTNVEIDNILITRKCIFIIETKNWTKNVYINRYGEIFVDKIIEVKKNLITSMSNKRIALWGLLKENGIHNIKIQEILVNANPHNEISNDSSKLLIINNTSDIVSYIVNYKSEDNFDREAIENIEKIINDNIYCEMYPVEYDIDSFKCDVAELIIAFNNEYNVNISDNQNTEETFDLKHIIIDVIKNNFSVKKCAGYAAIIALSLLTGRYLKVK